MNAKDVITRPEYTGVLPSPEDLDAACTETMQSPTCKALFHVADKSDSMNALLAAMEQTAEKYQVPHEFIIHQARHLLRGIMIGILAERKRNRGTQ